MDKKLVASLLVSGVLGLWSASASARDITCRDVSTRQLGGLSSMDDTDEGEKPTQTVTREVLVTIVDADQPKPRVIISTHGLVSPSGESKFEALVSINSTDPEYRVTRREKLITIQASNYFSTAYDPAVLKQKGTFNLFVNLLSPAVFPEGMLLGNFQVFCVSL